MEVLGIFGIALMIGCMIWVIVDVSRRVAHNRIKENREKKAIRWTIERECQAANDVAEGLYRP